MVSKVLICFCTLALLVCVFVVANERVLLHFLSFLSIAPPPTPPPPRSMMDALVGGLAELHTTPFALGPLLGASWADQFQVRQMRARANEDGVKDRSEVKV